MKKRSSNYRKYFRVIPLVLSCLILVPISNSEEANLKINILNLEKPGFLYLSICKDEAGFNETVENESQEESCVASVKGIDLQNTEINNVLPYGEYAITLFVDFNGNQKLSFQHDWYGWRCLPRRNRLGPSDF